MARPSRARDVYLAVSCKTCGQEKWVQCINKRGNLIPPAASHMARQAEALETKRGFTDPLHIGVEPNHVEPAPVEKTESKAEERNGHIRTVLFGIAIARKIGTTQAQIDRSLAEMVVDGGFFEELGDRLFPGSIDRG